MWSRLFIPCAMVMAFLGLVSFAGATAQPAMPEQPLPMKGSQKTVMFPHVAHSKIECIVCHHKVNDKETFQNCSSAGCHDDLSAKKGEKSLYFVVHNKSADLRHDSCMRCHAKTVEEKPDLKKELTGCKGSKCHPDNPEKS